MNSTPAASSDVERPERTNGPQGAKPGTPVTPDEVSRRTMLRGVAVGGLALPLLAACGGGDSTAGGDSSPSAAQSSAASPSAAESSAAESAAPESSAAASPSKSAAAGGVTVAEADVPVGGGTILKSDKLVVTQPTKGEFKAFSAVCTHQACLVGSVTDGQIVCPCHNSHFSIEDGSPLAGPASKPLGAKKATLAGGQVSVT